MSGPNIAGDAFAEDDLYDMTDPVTRATWTEDGLRLFLTHIREVYGEEFYRRIVNVARVESDARAGDPDTLVVDCATCEGPSTVTGGWIAVNGDSYLRLSCGHSVKA